jgi:uncharacterized membrane protein YkoI
MRLASVCLTAALLAMANISIAEDQIKKSDLPPAVQKTADAQSTGATVLGYAKDVEHGRVEYEVQLMVGDHTKDVTIDPQGGILEIEEQVAPEALPANVFHGLSARARKGRLVKVESLTRQGRIVAYEAEVITGGKHSEIQVGPDGEKLAHQQ